MTARDPPNLNQEEETIEEQSAEFTLPDIHSENSPLRSQKTRKYTTNDLPKKGNKSPGKSTFHRKDSIQDMYEEDIVEMEELVEQNFATMAGHRRTFVHGS